MKNIVTYLLLAFLVFSCSTSDDNPSTDAVPLSPTELKGNLTGGSQVSLNWTDNSTNETGFKIERKTGNGNYAQIGTVGSDITSYADSDLVASTEYTYRVLAYNKAGNSATYSNQVVITAPEGQTIPTVVTSNISSITTTSAVGGGNITSDGGSTVSSRGIVWSTSQNPTIELATKTSNGTGTGTFTSSLSGLTQKTVYYVRAYATNSIGTSYGSQISFNTATQSYCDETTAYPTVTIGTQVWMQKNLNVCKYRNGDDIPQVQDPTQWANLTTGAWCYYENNTANGPVYGKLYNWYAVNDPRGLAPVGWHIPSDSEWSTLVNYLGGPDVAGGKLKEAGTAHWESPNSGSTNSSGFTGLPCGFRAPNGSFQNKGTYVYWWTSVFASPNYSISFYMYPSSNQIEYNDFGKADGLSVRCVKN